MMPNPICSYCRSEWRSSEFHDTCRECGAGKLQAMELIESPRAFRDADPASPYWADGGVSVRSVEQIFAVWK